MCCKMTEIVGYVWYLTLLIHCEPGIVGAGVGLLAVPLFARLVASIHLSRCFYWPRGGNNHSAMRPHSVLPRSLQAWPSSNVSPPRLFPFVRVRRTRFVRVAVLLRRVRVDLLRRAIRSGGEMDGDSIGTVFTPHILYV